MHLHSGMFCFAIIQWTLCGRETGRWTASWRSSGQLWIIHHGGILTHTHTHHSSGLQLANSDASQLKVCKLSLMPPHKDKTIIRSDLFPALSVQNSSNPKSGERIRSVPGKSVRPVRSSAMMQPTDQMSTIWFSGGKIQLSVHIKCDLYV